MKNLLIILFLSATVSLFSQNSTIKVAVSRDTILLGNAFYLLYSFELKDAQFKAPKFENAIILGQSMMNNTSFADGQMKAISSQRYLIQPSGTGVFRIPATTIISSSGNIEVPAIEVFVKANPSNLELDPEEDKDWKTKDVLTNKDVNSSPSRKTKKI